MLNCKNISIKSDSRNLINNFNINLKKKEILTIKGSSGIGKTTLLKFILGVKLDNFIYSGNIFLNNVDITNYLTINRNISMIFQDDFLFPNLNVIQNLELINKLDKKKPRELLEQNNLLHLKHSKPSNISGGELSRILLLRILLLDTDIVLLDEPFNGIDKNNKTDIKQFFYENLINNEKGAILVTHNDEDIYDNKKVINL